MTTDFLQPSSAVQFPLCPEENIYVCGHRGMVGSAIVRKLREKGCLNILTRTHGELDLTNQKAVHDFFTKHQIDRVILAAAKVGGIHANNTYPAEFIYQNIMIQANVIHAAWQAGVKHLLFLGSSCIYPKLAPQPMQESHLLTGPLEPTNESYAIAKIAGIKMCEAYNRQYGTFYRSVMPTNLYGPGDNYHLENSHVIPAMIRKYHLAKLALSMDEEGIGIDIASYGEIPTDIRDAIGLNDDNTLQKSVTPKVILWGSGTPRREFLYVDDMARASLYVMELSQDYFTTTDPDHYKPSFVNVGIGVDQTIRETASLVSQVVGFPGETIFDSTRLDGTPRKLLNTSAITKMGWKPQLSLQQGLKKAYAAYLAGLTT